MRPDTKKKTFMHITRLTFIIRIFISLAFVIGIILWLFK